MLAAGDTDSLKTVPIGTLFDQRDMKFSISILPFVNECVKKEIMHSLKWPHSYMQNKDANRISLFYLISDFLRE